MKNKRRNKGFTLIELIAVLVILAVIATIVTLLVLNVVRKAKDSANRRSVDAYGKAIDLAIASYLLDTGEFPTDIDDLKVEYSGSEVSCKIQQIKQDSSIYLSECTVERKEVKDSTTDDGFYHYGNLIEIENNLSNEPYKVGDQVTYRGMDFYVIADSNENMDYVTLLKAEPLTFDEVNEYGEGHVNMYSTYDKSVSSYHQAYNKNGYGGMAYYTSSNCGYPTAGNKTVVTTGCITDYNQSDIKYVVDAWVTDRFKTSDLKADNLGYKARLITYDELINNLGYNNAVWHISHWIINPEYTPDWVYKNDYGYWTMSSKEDSNIDVWYVSFGNTSVYNSTLTVRPVVTLYKSAL